MNESSQKQSRTDLELDSDIRARLGETRYGLIKLWVRDVNGLLDATVAPVVKPDSRVLDAGSSRGDPDLPSLRHAGQTVACDGDLPGLRANSLTNHRVASFLEALPFRDNSFDVVVCKFVVEHLAAPLAVFREFWRVLRPGGIVAIFTPNRWSLFTLLSSLLPYRLKLMFKRSVFCANDEDTFATLYRANSRRKLRTYMEQAGFDLQGMRMIPGMWAFFIFNRRLAMAVRYCERIQERLPVFRASTTYILGLWQKPLGVESVP
jgi:SAM-dependent methyltransferase